MFQKTLVFSITTHFEFQIQFLNVECSNASVGLLLKGRASRNNEEMSPKIFSAFFQKDFLFSVSGFLFDFRLFFFPIFVFAHHIAYFLVHSLANSVYFSCNKEKI